MQTVCRNATDDSWASHIKITEPMSLAGGAENKNPFLQRSKGGTSMVWPHYTAQRLDKDNPARHSRRDKKKKDNVKQWTGQSLSVLPENSTRQEEDGVQPGTRHTSVPVKG